MEVIITSTNEKKVEIKKIILKGIRVSRELMSMSKGVSRECTKRSYA